MGKVIKYIHNSKYILDDNILNISDPYSVLVKH